MYDVSLQLAFIDLSLQMAADRGAQMHRGWVLGRVMPSADNGEGKMTKQVIFADVNCRHPRVYSNHNVHSDIIPEYIKSYIRHHSSINL